MISKLLNLIIFLLPLYLIKFKTGFVPFNVLELMIWLTFALWVARKRFQYFNISAFQNLEMLKYKNIFLPSLLILFGAIISVLLSPDISVSAGILKSWFLAPMVLGLMVYTETKNEKSARRLLGALFASASVIAVIALVYYASGRLTFDGRLAAFYLSPNHLAMYLAPGFLIGLFFIKSPRAAGIASGDARLSPLFQRGVKFASLIGLIFIGAALYLTYSYAAWLAIIIVIGVRWLVVGGRRKRIIYAAGLLVLIAVLFFLQIGSDKLDNLFNAERSSWQSRLMIWKAALEILKDQPVFGIGPGLFQEYYLKYQGQFLIPYLEWAVPQPHNIFLAFWLQAGILGLVGFLWLLAVFFKKIWPQIKKQDQLALTLLLLMIYTILHGLVDTTYWKNDLAVIFWLIVVLAVATFSAPDYK